MWQCPVCELSNYQYQQYCKACYFELPPGPITHKTVDKLLVCGYIKTFAANISSDVMNLVLLWYHVSPYFLEAGDQCIISGNQKIVSHTSEALIISENSCYASIEMFSMSSINVEYVYKVKILTG
eukprot:308089_1